MNIIKEIHMKNMKNIRKYENHMKIIKFMKSYENENDKKI